MAKGDMVRKDFKHPINPKRGKAKAERKKGVLAMGEVSPDEWAKRFDPLYGIKGIQRHLKLKFPDK